MVTRVNKWRIDFASLLKNLASHDFITKAVSIDSVSDNLNRKIRDIKANLESHKLQNKHEIDNIKQILNDVEKSQDLISQKFEEQNIKISKLNARQ